MKGNYFGLTIDTTVVNEYCAFDVAQPIDKSMFGRSVLHKGCDVDSVSIPDVVYNEGVSAAESLFKAITLCESTSIMERDESVLTEGGGGVIEAIKTMFKKLWESLKAFFSRVWLKVSNVFAERTKIVKDKKAEIIQGASYTDTDDNEKELAWCVADLATYAGKTFTDVPGLATAMQASVDGKFTTAVKDVVSQTTTVLLKTAGTGGPEALDKNGAKKAFSLKTGSTARAIDDADDKATYSSTATALKDAKESIVDKIDDLMDDGDEVALSTKINEAMAYYDKAAYKTLADLSKNLQKDVDKAQKEVNKFKVAGAGGVIGTMDTQALQCAFAIISFQQYLVTKHLMLHKRYADVAWKFIDASLLLFPKVKKQRNVGESTSITSKFGL